MQSASATLAAVVTPPASQTLPRYTIGITLRQEEMILSECRRRGIGTSEMIRRILDGWAERKIVQQEKEAAQ